MKRLKFFILFVFVYSCTNSNSKEVANSTEVNQILTPNVQVDTSYGKAFGEIYFGLPRQGLSTDTIFNKPFYPDGIYFENKLTALLLHSSEMLCSSLYSFNVSKAQLERERKAKMQDYHCEPKDLYTMVQIFETLKEKYGKGKKNDDDLQYFFKHWDFSKYKVQFYHRWENPDKIIYLGFKTDSEIIEKYILGEVADRRVTYYPAILTINKKLFNEQKGKYQLDSLKSNEQENKEFDKDKTKF